MTAGAETTCAAAVSEVRLPQQRCSEMAIPNLAQTLHNTRELACYPKLKQASLLLALHAARAGEWALSALKLYFESVSRVVACSFPYFVLFVKPKFNGYQQKAEGCLH